jgi:LuxR family maltose regulon positive regulatory protein
LRQAQGDLPGAIDLLAEAEQRYDTDFSPPVRPVHAEKARTQLASGDVQAAIRWAADHGLGPDDELSYVREFEHVTLSRVLLAQRSIDDATGLLDRLLAAARAGERGSAVVEILTLLAVAHDAGGNRAAALADLEEALTIAEPEGSVRVFLDAGPSVVALLRSATFAGPAAIHARRVLDGAGPGRAPTSSSGALVDPLSPRELEVLRLLRSDLSGPDIARELVVSLNTLRTHTKSIYAKLAVTNRREAVTRAQELGLV